MSLVLRVLVGAALLLSVAACGTVEGVGKDVSNSSRWIRDKVF